MTSNIETSRQIIEILLQELQSIQTSLKEREEQNYVSIDYEETHELDDEIKESLDNDLYDVYHDEPKNSETNDDIPEEEISEVTSEDTEIKPRENTPEKFRLSVKSALRNSNVILAERGMKKFTVMKNHFCANYVVRVLDI